MSIGLKAIPLPIILLVVQVGALGDFNYFVHRLDLSITLWVIQRQEFFAMLNFSQKAKIFSLLNWVPLFDTREWEIPK